MYFSRINLSKAITLVFVLCVQTILSIGDVQSVTGRHPTGVNVNTNGTSTVLITFQNLEANEIPVDAFWCGDVSSTGIVIGNNPCVPGTILGHLPKQFDLARISDGITVTGPTDLPTLNKSKSNNKNRAKLHGPRNLTDVMSIPTAVVRRAYQQAKRGASSEFFYVRQFNNNGIMTYVTVTCRMAGGGARTPLSLTKVDLDFEGKSYRQAITLIKQSTVVPEFSAEISFTGSGLIKGRWEIVMPGDPEPNRFDLLSEASLPPVERVLQKRYRLLSRFQKFVSPTGRTIIQGPNPKLLPSLEKGMYRILLRIEASSDKEGNSETTIGTLKTGGVAGFPMPTLRYFVGDNEQLKQSKKLPPISLLLPHSNQTLPAVGLKFTWFDIQAADSVAAYRIEFYQQSGEKKLIASAIKKPGESQFSPSETTLKKLIEPFLWRVVAINSQGKALSTSQLRNLQVRTTKPH